MPLYPDPNPTGGGPGAVTSVFGRIGAVIATLGDYAASLITNDSSVPGATVKDALENLASTPGLRVLGPVLVPASTTVIIDVLATSKKFVIWHLLLDQPLATKLTQATIHCVNNGVTPIHIGSEEVGSIQSYVTSTVIAVGTLQLHITNNEVNDITVTGKVIEP